jgi:hypothetical protein
VPLTTAIAAVLAKPAELIAAVPAAPAGSPRSRT